MKLHHATVRQSAVKDGDNSQLCEFAIQPCMFSTCSSRLLCASLLVVY
jgi:hypothetical protein